MKKEIIRRKASTRGGEVLYESPEPLFPPIDVRARAKRRLYAACLVLLLITAAVIWATAAGIGEKSPTQSDTESAEAPATQESTERETEPDTPDTETLEESKGYTEDNTDFDNTETQATIPVETERGTVDVSDLWRGEDYVINYTGQPLDVAGLIDRGFVYTESRYQMSPVVMIIHTHTSEQYGDGGAIGGVVAVGDKMSAVLNSLGIPTVHCTVIHDGGGQNAYVAARETVKTMLKIYPTVKYVIDVHRMELYSGDGKPAATALDNDGAAQIRISVSSEQKSAGIWQDDLSLALSLRELLNEDGNTSCAPVSVTYGGYNADLSRFYLTVEIGSWQNTVSEAKKAGVSLAQALVRLVLESK